MGSKTSFERDNTIRLKLTNGGPRAKAYLSSLTTRYGLVAESLARQRAPWRDRTGNARQGLVGVGDNSGASQGHWEVTIAHSVSYGIWLEVRFGGRYAIIRPTLDVVAPMYFSDATKIMGAMYG